MVASVHYWIWATLFPPIVLKLLILHQKCSGYSGVWGFHLFAAFWGFVLRRSLTEKNLVFWSYAPEKETESPQITTSHQHIISVCSYWKEHKGSICNAILTKTNTLFEPQFHKKMSLYNTLEFLTGVTKCWKGTVLSLSVNSNLLKCAANLYPNGTEWGISLRVTFTTQLHWHWDIQIVPECTPTLFGLHLKIYY